MTSKESVRNFWNDASCGERLQLPSLDRAGFEHQARERYRLEPYIEPFAEFQKWRGHKVLEIGVGLGADHHRFVDAGADTFGIDLTPRAIEMCGLRLKSFGLRSDLRVADAENLPFGDQTFDLVWSWGVIHHSPDTVAAIREIRRVLRPGGTVKVMIYHTWSMVGLMLWARYGLLRGRPLTTLKEIYSRYLESPGTKAFTRGEALELFSTFEDVHIETILTHGDLLSSGAGQRHEGAFLTNARRLWPRRLISLLFPQMGLFMLIQGRRPSE
jgi:SAM-dependent methyltransferase